MKARLWKRNNGQYYALWEEDGRTRQKSLKTDSLKIANRRLKNFNRDLLAGSVKKLSQTVPKVTLGELREAFLKFKDGRVAKTTLAIYETSFDHAEKTLGEDIPITHITQKRLEQVMDDMMASGLKPPTVNKHRRHLRTVFNQAYDWNYLEKPIKMPKPLREEERLRFLSIDELRKLIDCIDDQEFFDFCMLSAYTGMRSGELLRMMRGHVDRPEGFLLVTSEQKNKADWIIPINDHAREILDRCLSRNHGPRVFPKWRLEWVSKKFKKYARKSGLKDCRFHDLRHTFASHLAMGGQDLLVIQMLMRHKSMSSTMVYAKLSPEHLSRASNSLNFGPMPIPSTKKDGKA